MLEKLFMFFVRWVRNWALEDSPRSIHPGLLALKDKTIFTPHLGSAVNDVHKEIALEAARNIIQALEGRIPSGALNRIDETATGSTHNFLDRK